MLQQIDVKRQDRIAVFVPVEEGKQPVKRVCAGLPFYPSNVRSPMYNLHHSDVRPQPRVDTLPALLAGDTQHE